MADTLLIRADASAAIGTGHVMRCLALAQQWRQGGGRVVFAQAETTPALEQRLRAEDLEPVSLPVARGSADDAARTGALACDVHAAWVVADGYAFGAEWQRRLRAAGLRLLVLDDHGQAERYHANVILNQNLSAEAAWYARCEPHTRLLLGTPYALLRREFLQQPWPPRTIPAIARKVLVTLGGSDPDNVTGQVIDALRPVPDIEVAVVVGGLNPHRAALAAAVEAWPARGATIRLVSQAPNMPELMAWADVAVAACGSTVWELAFMGLPTLGLVLADNQAPAAGALDAAGIAQLIRSPDALPRALAALLPDAGLRRQRSDAARRLVDGRGVARVIAQLEAA